MAEKTTLTIAELRKLQSELDADTQRRIKGGFRIVPNIKTSYGTFPWLEIDIRNPSGSPAPGKETGVKIINVVNP